MTTPRVRLAGGTRRSAAQQQARRTHVEQRRERILHHLPVGGGAPVSVADLARDLGLAASDVRSDLDALVRRGQVALTASGQAMLAL